MRRLPRASSEPDAIAASELKVQRGARAPAEAAWAAPNSRIEFQKTKVAIESEGALDVFFLFIDSLSLSLPRSFFFSLPSFCLHKNKQTFAK